MTVCDTLCLRDRGHPAVYHRPATSTSARVQRVLVDPGQLRHLRGSEVHSNVRHHEHRRPHRH